MQIPIIDFQPFTEGDSATRQAVAQQIYQACHEIGFMYLKNPGISPQQIEALFNQSKFFFNLPLEVKQQLAWSDKVSNRGYVGVERERLDPDKPGDLKEAFNVGKEVKSYDVAPGMIVNKWLPDQEDFQSDVLAFWDTCCQVTEQVLQAFAIALQVPEDFFATKHDQQNHTLRLLHYPPIAKLPKLGQVRAGAHSDYGSITLLFQDQIGGLEVQTKDSEWILAPAIPDTVVVNTGDLMQRWTNHVFCSTKHRVMIPTDERIERSRYSVAFFCHPNHDAEIACLPCCSLENPAIYPPISAGDHLLSRLQATY
ncbi:2-oxoglutarate and iron-dependent oxygenase domain-containing protein [Gloeocapsopsis sp. IPPAS B-1203]|uniref:isopenicillin N synthase family dioxygenase n=1 Tax=Gloeocapsopsis sp. IPPAS B-1203 TaxID=2049454 RepID=UPI000C1A0D03|nr:2-oxoglutarate and iron-dependent oxygenase domain-containing protein [Gloeocapsopsis sp. IPPAS B-1203]PIG91733.1 2OG-Fe(II) oxygenase [Gloeocapsopsis sp. IPPAS B-1203]